MSTHASLQSRRRSARARLRVGAGRRAGSGARQSVVGAAQAGRNGGAAYGGRAALGAPESPYAGDDGGPPGLLRQERSVGRGQGPGAIEGAGPGRGQESADRGTQERRIPERPRFGGRFHQQSRAPQRAPSMLRAGGPKPVEAPVCCSIAAGRSGVWRRSACLSVPALLAAALAISSALAQSPSAQSGPASAAPRPTTEPASGGGPSAKKAPAAARAKSPGAPSHYLPNRFAGRAGAYYKVVWGIDSLRVKWAESGELIRFSWRVLDPQRAQVLKEKKGEPALIDPSAGVSLVVPQMEKIGQLRQSQTPEAGRSYWMAFSNKGRLVKRGDRVDVVIGPFRAEKLA